MTEALVNIPAGVYYMQHANWDQISAKYVGHAHKATSVFTIHWDKPC